MSLDLSGRIERLELKRTASGSKHVILESVSLT